MKSSSDNGATSSQAHYLQFPLSLLRHARTPREFFNGAAFFSCVKAGLSKREKDADLWDSAHMEVPRLSAKKAAMLSQAFAGLPWKASLKDHVIAAHVGKQVCGIDGGDPLNMAISYAETMRKCSPALVRVSSKIFWAAAYDAREKEDLEAPDGQRLGWRQFRVLVALLSAPCNSKNFAVIGWEGIQHRACGFHRREDFKAFEASDEPWPHILLPIPTRKMIRDDLQYLEANRFFIRHRISIGSKGGLSAYSFRHETRERLAHDAIQWQAHHRGDVVEKNRLEDLRLHAAIRLKRAESAANTREEVRKLSQKADALEVENALQSPANPHESSKEPSEGQVMANRVAKGGANDGANLIRNNRQKSPLEILLRGTSPPPEDKNRDQENIEHGYLIRGKFLTSAKANEFIAGRVDIAAQLCNEAKPAIRRNGKIEAIA
jgi:hypothetical protein